MPLPTGSTRLAAYAGLATVDTWLAGRTQTRRTRVARALTKPALMPALAAAVPPASAGVGVGLVGSWQGDVALLADGPRAFRWGIASFAAAHLGYVTTLAGVVDRDRLRTSRRVRGLVLSTAATAPVMGLAARRIDPSLALPVTAYTALVSATGVLTQVVAADQPRDARLLLAAGGLTFLVSDTTLGTRDLLLADCPDARTRPLERAVMATYTLAQLLLLEGFRRLRR